jgi:DNA-binding response OmpR family regulator
MAYKILTVDDSKTIRMIVKKAFRPYNCELFEGENGVEGLAIAAKEMPDLIILDITMPVMNGIEMLGKLKAENDLKDIPVIMLTAESGKENVMQIVKMGVKDYIVKPFKGEQLIERAKNIIKLKPVE